MLVEKKLRPLGVLAARRRRRSPDLKKVDPLLALKFRAAVVPERLVDALTTVFRPLFLPPVVLRRRGRPRRARRLAVRHHGVAQSLRQALYDPLFILFMLGLVVLSAAFHEIGHAAACRYGGATPGAMGVGLYIVWPAFYTDVTDAYRLGRRRPAAHRPRRRLLQRDLRARQRGAYFAHRLRAAAAARARAALRDPPPAPAVHPPRRLLHRQRPHRRARPVLAHQAGAASVPCGRRPSQRRRAEALGARRGHGATCSSWSRSSLFMLADPDAPAAHLRDRLRLVHGAPPTSWVTRVALAIRRRRDPAASCSLLIPLGLVLTFVQLGRKALVGAWRATEGRPAARAALATAAATAAAFRGVHRVSPARSTRPIPAGRARDDRRRRSTR